MALMLQRTLFILPQAALETITRFGSIEKGRIITFIFSGTSDISCTYIHIILSSFAKQNNPILLFWKAAAPTNQNFPPV